VAAAWLGAQRALSLLSNIFVFVVRLFVYHLIWRCINTLKNINICLSGRIIKRTESKKKKEEEVCYKIIWKKAQRDGKEEKGLLVLVSAFSIKR